MRRANDEAQQARESRQRLETELRQTNGDRQRLESDLRGLRQEMENWKQRALSQPGVAPAPVAPPPAAAKKDEPAEPVIRPIQRPAPSSDLYCLPPRKLRDDF